MLPRLEPQIGVAQRLGYKGRAEMDMGLVLRTEAGRGKTVVQ